MQSDNKYKSICKCMDIWMTEHENNNTIALYLLKHGYHKIGIYGYGVLGRHLVTELEQHDIEIEWIMDQRDLAVNTSYAVIKFGEENPIPKVEVIIVTAITDYEEIELKLCSKVNFPVICLREILEEMGRERLYV